jgi:hypothetical protein
MHQRQYLRPADAADYLKSRYGYGAVRTLAKLRVIGGGPAFHRSGRLIVYEPAALDAWALSRLSVPLHSTSDVEAA